MVSRVKRFTSNCRLAFLAVLEMSHAYTSLFSRASLAPNCESADVAATAYALSDIELSSIVINPITKISSYDSRLR
jgi:hypothetical protein